MLFHFPHSIHILSGFYFLVPILDIKIDSRKLLFWALFCCQELTNSTAGSHFVSALVLLLKFPPLFLRLSHIWNVLTLQLHLCVLCPCFSVSYFGRACHLRLLTWNLETKKDPNPGDADKSFIISLTQPRDTWEEGHSIEECLSSYWPVSIRACLH